MLKDYDMIVLYHPSKANLVVDSLSHLSMENVSHVEESKRNYVKDVHRFSHLGVRIESSPNGSMLIHYNSKSSLMVEI